MQFPQDGGLSCVPYFLAKRDPELEGEAMSLMASRARHVGSMICQCKADKWWQVLHPLRSQNLVDVILTGLVRVVRQAYRLTASWYTIVS